MEALIALFFTFGLMWLLLIRPQQRRMRAHQRVVAELEEGDEVVTAGGIHGTITAVDGDEIRLEIAPGVVIRVLRGAISQRATAYDEADEDDDDEDYDDEDAYEDEDEDDDDTVDDDDTADEHADADADGDPVNAEPRAAERLLDEDKS